MLPISLPPGLDETDLNSRQRMAVVAVAALVHQCQPATLVQMVEEGEKRFIRNVSGDEGFGSQDLTMDDYRLMYLVLTSHVQQNLVTTESMRADG